MNTIVRDIVGTEIIPGSFVAYPFQYCDSPAMKLGKVLKVVATPKDTWNGPGLDYAITVRGIELHMAKVNPTWEGTRTGTLRFPERLIVLDRNKIDPEIVKILEAL